LRRSPSIIPDVADRDVYLVLDDFGRLGRSWRDTDEQSSDRTALVQDLLEGQYNNPVLVIAFNVAKGWSRDVSEEIADEIVGRCGMDGFDVPLRRSARNGAAAATPTPAPKVCMTLPVFPGST